MIPTAIGRYQILGEIGAGGFATVFRAHDPTLERDVALKVLHAHLARDPSIRERFIREGRALARLHHPNLVQVYDAGEIDGQVYLAMQFIPGRSLADIARGRVLSLEELAPVVRQVAAALDEIHAAGLVHRDVKPANILLTDTGRAVLLDLGIARDVNNVTVTASSLIVGTPGYLAPEQVDSSLPTGPHTDVYQLGATMYALLAGRAPFEGDTAQVLFSVVNRAPPDLGELRPDLPLYAVGAIAEAMAKDHTRRPATATAFAAALTAGMDPTITHVASDVYTRPSALPQAAATPVRPSSAVSTKQTRPLLLAGAGVLALVLLGGTVYALRGGSGGDNGGTRASALGIGGATVPAGQSTSGTGATPSETRAPADKGGKYGIAVGGDAVTISLDKGGQEATLTFEGKAGQFLAIGASRVNVVSANNSNGVYVSVRDPNGRPVLDRQWFSKDGGGVMLPQLRANGDYTLAVLGDKESSGGITLTLSQAVGGTLTSGQGTGVNIERTGQYARLTFEGRRDQFYSLGVTRVQMGRGNAGGLQISVIDADGRKVVDGQWIGKDGGATRTPALRANGTYTVIVAPDQGDTGSLTVTLSQPVTGTLAVDGQSVAVNLEQPGQYARLAFEGKRDQYLSLGVEKITVGSTAPHGVYVSVLNPDGRAVVDRTWVGRDGESVPLPQLRIAGTFTVVIEPDDVETGSASVTLSQPVAATITADGQPVTLSIERAGQYARLTFEGQQGQDLMLAVSRASIGSTGRGSLYVSVLTPDGKFLINRTWVPSENGKVNTKPLAATGTYTIFVATERAETGTVTLTLRPASGP